MEETNEHCWCDRLDEYEQALQTLREIASHSETLRGRMDEHQEELVVWQKEREELERRKGEDWRHNLQPLIVKRDAASDSGEAARHQAQIGRQTAIRATAFDVPIEIARERIAATRHLLAEFRRQRKLLERGPEASAARARIAEITHGAEMARLEIVRNAYLTIESLEHTNLRPTAWWLPFVDPTGAWFDAITTGTKARLEETVMTGRQPS